MAYNLAYLLLQNIFIAVVVGAFLYLNFFSAILGEHPSIYSVLVANTILTFASAITFWLLWRLGHQKATTR